MNFRETPFFTAHRYAANGSYVDVQNNIVKVSVVQAARLPPNSTATPVIYLWHGNKGIRPQELQCKLTIESLSKTLVWGPTEVIANCIINGQQATIENLRMAPKDGVARGYSDVPLPLLVKGEFRIA